MKQSKRKPKPTPKKRTVKLNFFKYKTKTELSTKTARVSLAENARLFRYKIKLREAWLDLTVIRKHYEIDLVEFILLYFHQRRK